MTTLTDAQRVLLARMSAAPGEREGLFPVTAAQRGLWFLDQLAPGGTAYHMPALLRLRGPLEEAALERAFQAAVDRHESLRTTFAAVDGRPLQRVRSRREHRLTTLDAAGRPFAEVVAEATEAAYEPFDLRRGPLVRTVLWRLGPEDHLLLLAVHHIVADGWSVGVLLRELAADLAGHPAAARPDGAAEPVDLALREAATAVDGAAAAFWAGALAGAEPCGLPGRLDEPPERACATVREPLPASLPERVRAYARSARVTEHSVYLAVLAAACHRMTGRRDVVIGVPHARRDNPRTQLSVGFLVTSLPVRVAWAGEPSLTELTALAARALRAAVAHADVPPEPVTGQAGTGGRGPLFDLMLTVDPPLLPGGRLGHLAAERLPLDPRAAKFPLVAGFDLGDPALRCEYDTGRFDAEVAGGLARTVRTLLESGLAAPDVPLAAFDLMDARETGGRLALGPGPAAPDVLAGAGLGEAVARVAARDPGRVALVEGERRLTYGELLEDAGRLAAAVRARLGGDPPVGRPVAVLLERGLDQAVACLATVLAGGHHLALDPAHPAEHHWDAVARSDACLLLTSSGHLDALGAAGVPALCLDRLPPAGSDSSVPAGHPGLPAAVVGTGALFTHDAVARTGGSWARGVRLHTAPVSSPAALAELWGTLLTGSRGVILGPDDLTPEAVREAVRTHGITDALLTTRLSGRLRHETPDALTPITNLLVSRTALTPHTLHPAGGRPRAVYGPADGPAVATAAPPPPPGRAAAGDGVPCGRAVAGVEVYVLDDRMRPVPPGAVGEIHLGGPGLPLGFPGRPGRTAERLVPSPYGHGQRLLRTGERARVRPDGTLVPLGVTPERLLEERLAAHPGARDVVAVERDGLLVAYVVPATSPPAADELRELAGEDASVLLVDRVPLDGDGEPDLDLLPVPEAPARAPAAPATELERQVAQAWAEVLGRDAAGISRSDDFFRLGGHSLLATRLVARLAQRLSRPVPVQFVFDHPTLAASARALAAVPERDAVPPIRRVADRDLIPLSFAQRRLWFMQQYDPSDSLFNIPLAVRLRGELDVAALRGALALVTARHETLRTTYVTEDDLPRPRVRTAPGPALEVAGAPDEAALARLLDRAARTPFDLAEDLPLRALLVRTAPAEHVLLLVVHHIACDGWSVGVLATEVSLAYTALTAGREPELPGLPVQYGDFALWQRDRMSDRALAPELEHWSRVLDGAPKALELPADRPRPPVFAHRGATLPVELGPELSAAVRRTAAAHEVTPFMVLLSALAVVLSRLSGQDDLVIGTPVAGRSRPEVEDLVGCFIDVVPLRLDVSGDPAAGELLARARRVCLEAYAHQDVPFERLVEHLRPERDLSRTPVFQVMLALQSGATPGLDLPGVTASHHPLDTGTAQHDLTFWLRDAPSGIGGFLEFDTDLFTGDTAARYAGRLAAVLDWLTGATPEPEALTPDERALLLAAGTGPNRPIPTGTVADAVLASAPPDRLALVDGVDGDAGRGLTHGRMGELARRTAAVLAARGVRRGDAVGVLLPRSPLMVPVLLGVWLAGAAYVPLDPEFPRRRLEFMIADSGVRVLVAESPDAAPVPGLDVVTPDDPAAGLPVPATGAGGRDRAYVMYTSGSTGRPKGVVVPHAAVLNLLASVCSDPGLGPDDVLVAVTTLSFDISVLELFAPLLAGARVVVATAAQAADPVLLGGLIGACGATVVQATPATWRMLLESGWRAERPLRVWSGGEALSPEVAGALLAAGHQVANLYGPTETTIWSATGPVEDPAAIALGRPVANTRLHVLDHNLRTLPEGAVGELYVGGAGVADGYLGRPALTAERFVPSPFATGERLYRTGDLVRFRGGRLSFAGRADQQVKLRGHRIEPGEIEARLAEHPDVAEAVVAVHDDRLVAYLVATPPSDAGPPSGSGVPSVAGVRAFLRDHLPEYMIPSLVVPLDRMPRTLNGKTDRGALPAPPDTAGTPRSADHVAPRTPLEAVVVETWADVLGLDAATVSAEDDFFDLGGHSMLATRAAGRLSRVLGRPVSLRRLFEHPTPAALAASLGSGDTAADQPDRPPLAPAADGGPAPLSYAQERLWFLHRLEGPSPTYNLPVALRLSGPLDRAALRAALGDLIGRHEILRTIFPDRRGTACQIVLDAAPADLDVVDVTAADLPARMESAARHAFDLTAEIPLRAWLFATGPGEHVLLLVIHHIAGDEGSLRPFLRDLGEAYLARLAGREPGWRALPVQYRDYAIWQRRVLGDQRDPAGELRRQLDFWTDTLRDLPAEPRLPTTRRRPAVAGHRGGSVGFTLDDELHERLKDLAGRSGATMFMVLQAAVAALLTRLGAGTDVPLGTAVDARGQEQLDGLVGLFVNTLVLRADTSGDPAFRDLLSRVRAADLAAYEHAELPFERLVEALNPVRSLSAHPLFQVAVAYQHAGPPPLDLAGLSVEVAEVGPVAAKFDLAFTVTALPDGAGAAGTLGYASDLFDHDAAASLVERLLLLLRGVAAEPDRPIGEIDVMDAAERRRLLLDWNDTAADLPAACWAETFEAQAARRPGDVALVLESERMTYGELDAAANRLAHLLAERGAGPERLVAVALPRSLGLFVALVAVLKTGAGYLPLDLDHPAERVSYMLADARPVVLLATADTAGLLPPGGPPVLLADDPDIAGRPSSPPVIRPPAPGNTAYVIYTSGSTGRPKGVVVTHASVPSLVATAVERFGVGAGSRVLQFASVSFDVAFWELSMALLTGARLVVVPAARRVAGEPLTGYVAEHGITHLALSPSLLAALPPGCDLPPDVTVLTGSETVPAEVVTRFAPGRRLLNAYGPTEATVNSTLWPAPEGWTGESVPIGGPDVGTRVHVLDAGLRLLPPGVAGELFIAGDGLARGYLGRPDLTAAAFLPDPFGPPGSRMYRTGDLVRWNGDGALEFLGRADDQVQIRGFRVEPGEVEATLIRHPDVRETVVVADPAQGRLVAYVGTGRVDEGLPAELRAFTGRSLPSYLVPSVFVPLEALPRAANGKVDRARLPEPRPAAGRVLNPPATPLERQVAEAVCEVLGVDAVGLDDDLFEQGGHSLQIPRIAAGVAERTGVEIALRDIFLAPTVAGMVRAVAGARDSGAARSTPITRADRRTRRRGPDQSQNGEKEQNG
ncbi:non-ribosomal peptide synthetase [Nonomuraea spiralis]|uniref:Non-ribosomal peptide synthetase n=1 Tax=Nonomuraea spiralis TaxID=46182 RepID=A0ABV5IV76_9ACTN|nr:non-ribosomal peptide synthetase [Nonomuraea spiralis]GGS82833.1 non-ribosomal peptide synthetase [Nonomuraea spiralis]